MNSFVPKAALVLLLVLAFFSQRDLPGVKGKMETHIGHQESMQKKTAHQNLRDNGCKVNSAVSSNDWADESLPPYARG